MALSGSLLVWAGSFVFFRNEGEVEHFIISVEPVYFVVTLVCIPIIAVMVMTFRKQAQR